MNNGPLIKKVSGIAVMALSVVLTVLSVFVSRGPANTEKAAARAGRILSHRLEKLDSCMHQVARQDGRAWMAPDGLLPEFVLYRYYSDTLQSWCNQFPSTTTTSLPSLLLKGFPLTAAE